MTDVQKGVEYGVSTEDFSIDSGFARRSELFYKYQGLDDTAIKSLFNEITASADVALATNDTASYQSAMAESIEVQEELIRRGLA